MPAEGPVRDRKAAGFHLIETMRWQPGTGFLRRSLHLSRLGGSAHALGFSLDMASIERALDAAVAGSGAPLRVRLGLDGDGRAAVATQPFTPLPDGTVWKLGIAATRLSSGNPILRHKTSLRDAYDAARAEFTPEEADEVLLRNEKGELCEGTISSLFVETGRGLLATPPLTSGLLAGVLRAELLAAGKALERVLHPRDLAAGGRIFVGNSLRGLIEARFPAD